MKNLYYLDMSFLVLVTSLLIEFKQWFSSIKSNIRRNPSPAKDNVLSRWFLPNTDDIVSLGFPNL